MPPRLVDYALADWLRLRPVVQGFKTARYRAVDRRFRGMPARSGDLAELTALLRGRRALITIAFNDPQTIAWQARLVRRYVADTLYVVADNSPGDDAAGEIARVAAAAGAPYMRLPRNLWSGASRSHGLALNWVWQNLVLPGQPQAFGFIDDDIYPTAPDDPFATLAGQDFYGVVRLGMPRSADERVSRWFLWAGFCMYRFAAVRDVALDFSQDWFLGLDTGGGNWEVLYRHVDRSRLREQSSVFVPYREGMPIEDAPLQWCGAWLHAVGLMGRPAFAADKARAIAEILRPHLAQAEPT